MNIFFCVPFFFIYSDVVLLKAIFVLYERVCVYCIVMHVRRVPYPSVSQPL